MKSITMYTLSLLCCLTLYLAPLASANENKTGENDKPATEVAVEISEDEKSEQEDRYWEVELGFIVGFGRNTLDWYNQSRHGNLIHEPWLAGGYYHGDFFVESNPAAGKLITVGYSLVDTDKWQVNLIATPFFLGFDEESQQRGNLLDGTHERETSLDAGIEMMYVSEAGQFGVRALHDTVGAHDGYAVALGYGYPVYLDKMAILPSLNLTYISSETNQYYYGVKSFEARNDLPVYDAGRGFVTKFNLYIEYELSERTALIGFSHLTFLNDDIHHSPLVARNTSFSVGMGMIWIF